MDKINYFLKSLTGVIIFNMIIFIAAGKLLYLQGAVYLLISIAGLVLNIITIKNNEELMKEREKPGENMKKWDKKILGLLALSTAAAYITAGLDSGRFYWTMFNTSFFGAGIVIVAAGQLIFLTAKNQNRFFSSVARIQSERNHQVCTGGVYKMVRHPGYLGMIISWIGFPMIMTSAYCVIPVLAAVSLLIARTYLEDKMLIEELEGYSDYAAVTRFRLVPFIW